MKWGIKISLQCKRMKNMMHFWCRGGFKETAAILDAILNTGVMQGLPRWQTLDFITTDQDEHFGIKKQMWYSVDHLLPFLSYFFNHICFTRIMDLSFSVLGVSNMGRVAKLTIKWSFRAVFWTDEHALLFSNRSSCCGTDIRES